MVQDMTGKRQNSYTFSLEAMTSFEGDTGPYLQYAHARLSSIMRKANIPEADLVNADLSLLSEKHATELIRMLSQYPDTVQNTLKTLEPTTVLTYLFKLTHVLSSSYDVLRVVGSEPEVLKARLALYYSTRTVLANGMRLLGLSPVQRYVEALPQRLSYVLTMLQDVRKASHDVACGSKRAQVWCHGLPRIRQLRGSRHFDDELSLAYSYYESRAVVAANAYWRRQKRIIPKTTASPSTRDACPHLEPGFPCFSPANHE